jgi:hypothetical protein
VFLQTGIGLGQGQEITAKRLGAPMELWRRRLLPRLELIDGMHLGIAEPQRDRPPVAPGRITAQALVDVVQVMAMHLNAGHGPQGHRVDFTQGQLFKAPFSFALGRNGIEQDYAHHHTQNQGYPWPIQH